MNRLRAHSNLIGLLVLAAVLALLGLVDLVRPFGVRFSDLTGRIVTMDTMVRIGILTIVVVGLNLLMGYAGQVSLGQAGFYALGAYFSGILTTLSTRHGLLPGISESWWWPWLVMLAGMLFTGSFAYLVGKPILRLKGNYLAMATLGLGFIINIFSGQFAEITGGYDGLTGVPRLRIGDFLFWPTQRYYFLVWAAALAAIAIALNIVNSRVGRALRAIHTNETAAKACGVDTRRYKVQALVISAMFASLAGSLYAHYQSAVSPNPFDFHASVQLVTMAAVGGLSSIWGAPLGVGVMYLVGNLIQARMESVLHIQGGEYELILYGLILVLIMIFLPQGVVSSLTAARRTWRRLRPGSEKADV
jgi:branched-chain amino acid transport system permease protein